MVLAVRAEKGSGDCDLSVRHGAHNGWKQHELDQPDVVARHVDTGVVLAAASQAYRRLELQYRRALRPGNGSVLDDPGQSDVTLIQQAFGCCRDRPGRQR